MQKHPNRIYKSIILPLKNLNKKDIDYLFECNRESAKVWNKCISLSKELWETEQKYVDRKYLQDNIKGFSKILTSIITRFCILIGINLNLLRLYVRRKLYFIKVYTKHDFHGEF